MIVNIVIIEDEKLAAERLQDLIAEIDPGITVMETLESVARSVAWLQTHEPDLIFMDIKLADGLCFDIFEQIKIKTPVIFTTAYDQYALKAFKLNSVDYLLKPIRKQDLQDALDKYRTLRSTTQPDLEPLLQALRERNPEYKKQFLIQVGDRITTVTTNNIAYFYAMEKYVFCTTFDKQSYTLDFSLDRLQEILDPNRFFRINRQMIINIDAIGGMVAFSRARIKIELTPPEPKNLKALVSTERSPAFKAWLDR
jgi:DNA-binding LytR/AlgR family response regulator